MMDWYCVVKDSVLKKIVAQCAGPVASFAVFLSLQCHAVLSWREAESKSLTNIADHITQ